MDLFRKIVTVLIFVLEYRRALDSCFNAKDKQCDTLCFKQPLFSTSDMSVGSRVPEQYKADCESSGKHVREMCTP